MTFSLDNKNILVTGACGSVGKELIKQISSKNYAPSEIIGIDSNENELFFLDQQYLNDARANFYVVDIRDRFALADKMRDVDVVFHCAALKHVVLCERSPEQAVMTNINGLQNIIAAAEANDVERVIFTSSDKAVNPTNVMGTSKLMGERLISAANTNIRSRKTIFASTRFGNILGSNGSVIPIFYNQIAKGGPVTLTNRNMTRFVMSVEAAVSLVIESASLAKGGEVFITKMPILRIEDLAKVMIAKLAPKFGYNPDSIKIIEIGMKPGEKLYEELMSNEELRRAVELQDYFSIMPAFTSMYNQIQYDYQNIVNDTVSNSYISSEGYKLSQDEIITLLDENGLLSDPGKAGDSRYWPGDKNE